DTSALNTVWMAHRPLGKNVVAGIAIVVWLGVDQAANRSVFGCNFGFHSAPGVVILRNDDRTFYRDAQAVELLVILGQAVVHKDQRRCNVAISRIRVVGGELLGLLVGGWIDGDGRFFQLGRESRGRDHFEHANLGR